MMTQQPSPTAQVSSQTNSADDAESYDIAIIGAGPAGLFACYYSGFREMKTILLDALPEAGGQLAVLYPEKFIFDVPGYTQILARDLVSSLVQQASRYNPTMRLGERAETLQSGPERGFTITTDKKKSFRTKSVLITAGVGSFSPNRLNILNQEKYEGNGIYYFVKQKSFFRDKNLLIVGGGDSACDWALNLKDVTRSITLIHRRDQFRAHEQSVKEVFSSPEIVVKTFTELQKVDGDSTLKTATIVENKTKAEETIPVDCVLINIGFKANLGPISNWGLAMENRAIKINGKMETNIPGVFAAGDIASPTDSVKLNLIATGFAQAALAVNVAKKYIDPSAQLFPGHSSEKSA